MEGVIIISQNLDVLIALMHIRTHIYIMHCYKDLILVVLGKICACCSMLLMRYILGHLLLNSTTMVKYKWAATPSTIDEG
jgi:hypothetical protein